MRPPPDVEPACPTDGGVPTPSIHELLATYLEDYFAEYDDLPWAELLRRQRGCHASLAFGAAGIAYAFWYGGHLRQDPALLAGAERWIERALAGQRRRLAFLYHDGEAGARMPPGAFLYGRSGLHFTRALIARSLADRPAEGRALARFAELSRAGADAGSEELYTGSAGCLAGTAILFQHLGGGRLRGLGTELAEKLVRRAAVDRRGRAAWNGLRGLGLAHGTAGPLLALLLWSEASGSPLPGWFVPTLAGLLAVARRSPERFSRRASRYGWLCTGVTGVAYLAARAAATVREPALLAGARGAARLALGHLPGLPDLCCGRAGCAYALLPLARQDPRGPWRKAARDLALSTLLCERRDWVTTGLYGGEAAIPCLALNLIHRIDSGPPCLDLLPPPAAVHGRRPARRSPGPRA